MAWMAVAASVAGSVLSGAMQADAASNASQQAAQGQSNSLAQQMQMFNTQNTQQQPYRQAGYNALNALQSGLGIGGQQKQTKFGDTPLTSQDAWGRTTFNPSLLSDPDYYGAWQSIFGGPGQGDSSNMDASQLSAQIAERLPAGPAGAQQQTQGGIDRGYFTHQFDANDLKTNLAPNYQFMLDQGLGATRNANNVTNSFGGGNTGKALVDYAENYAGNAYQNAFQNYTANQSNIYNRLASIAGLGQTANAQSSQLAGQLAPSIGAANVGIGNAQAAGTVGAAQALGQGANSAMGWYQLSNMMKPGGGSPSSQFDE